VNSMIPNWKRFSIPHFNDKEQSKLCWHCGGNFPRRASSLDSAIHELSKKLQKPCSVQDVKRRRRAGHPVKPNVAGGASEFDSRRSRHHTISVNIYNGNHVLLSEKKRPFTPRA
jgi:hypothetical protein